MKWLIGLSLLFSSISMATGEVQKITLTGSSTVAPLALEIAKRFEKVTPNVRVDVQTGGSSRGILDARKGVADIGMVSRDLKETEKDLIAFPVAKDGIAIILNKGNGLEKISSAQIRSIYLGKINNWKELGGKDLAITVVNKAEGRSTLELFLSFFTLKNSEISADVVIGDNEQGIKTVAGNPGAIGYVSVGSATYNASVGVPIKVVSVDGYAFSTANLNSPAFPFSRTLNFVTKEPPIGLKKQFIEFARSQKVEDLIEAQFFVPYKN